MWSIGRKIQIISAIACLLAMQSSYADPFEGTQKHGTPQNSANGNYVAQPNGHSTHHQNRSATNPQPQNVFNSTRSTESGLAIRTSQSSDGPGTEQGDKPQSTVSSATAMITKTLGALFGVIFLIVVVAQVLKKQNPVLMGGLPDEAVTVLGRRYVEQRQSIHLVRVGTRILVLGSSQQGLTPLSEVTDPVEVDYLSGLCHVEESGGRVAQTLRSLFTRGAVPKNSQAEATTTNSVFAKRFREDVTTDELKEHYADIMSQSPQYDVSTSMEESRG